LKEKIEKLRIELMPPLKKEKPEILLSEPSEIYEFEGEGFAEIAKMDVLEFLNDEKPPDTIEGVYAKLKETVLLLNSKLNKVVGGVDFEMKNNVARLLKMQKKNESQIGLV
jgi:hypothetical protein